VSVKVITEVETAAAKALAAFASELVGPDMAKSCMHGEVRRCAYADGYEFRVTFNYTGVAVVDTHDMARAAEAMRTVVDAVREGVLGLMAKEK